MEEIVYGKAGDEVLIVKVDFFGNDYKYLVERRYLNGYYTTFASFDYDKALEEVKRSNPAF